MATVQPPPMQTLADLLAYLGVPPKRVRYQPSPGQATEKDVLAIQAHEDRLYELVFGVLVEKAYGFRESCLEVAILGFLWSFIRPQNLGLISGPDGFMRMLPGVVRSPDIAFTSWDRIPGRRMPEQPIPTLVPDLAVGVLKPSNTRQEMARKRDHYFTAGVRLVWEVNPKTRSVKVYTGPDQFMKLGEEDILEGGEVLPGFALPLRELFSELDLQG
jgi:Uma2 family endonuclease